jgi:hypothetical protein
MSVYSLDRLIGETRRLAAEYRRATGKTLPVTAELAIQDAIRLLRLEPAPPGTVGHDAIRLRAGRRERLQIKGRAIFDENKPGHRIGQLKVEQDWDALILVLMDEQYEPCEIYEADRDTIFEHLNEGDGSQRNRKGAMSVARFKIIGNRVWTREGGLEDDGYWDNRASG